MAKSLSPKVTEATPAKSKAEFPKNTLEEALRIPSAIETANAGQPYPPTDIAIAMSLSPGSSTFRTILASSFRYGLTGGSYASDRITLEALGRSIVAPKTPDEAAMALAQAALNPPTFRQMYDYLKGKKIPEPNYLENTVVREFGVAKENAGLCVSIFITNMEYVGLVKVATTGKWLSSDTVPTPNVAPPEENEESQGTPIIPAALGAPTTASTTSTSPSGKNAIFVGHGKNKTPLAQLKAILDQYGIPYKVATEEANVFRPISEKVADTMHSCGAAILIFTADEEFRDVNTNVLWRPSENVIFELGAASALYGQRVIIFKEESVHFPSNFRDIGYIEFPKDSLSAKTNELFKELISFGLIKVTVGV